MLLRMKDVELDETDYPAEGGWTTELVVYFAVLYCASALPRELGELGERIQNAQALRLGGVRH